MNKAVKAVVFDFGHVLTLPPRTEDKAWLRERCGLSAEDYDRLWVGLRPELDRGTLTIDEYWGRLAAAGGSEPTPALLHELGRRDMESWTRPNRAMFRWARELRRGGWVTGILSNMPPEFLQLLAERFPEAEEFAPRIFSCQVGMIKPEPDIFLYCLRELGLPPEEVLFLDDTPPNVHAAAGLGIQALVFHSAADCARELEESFALPALDPAEPVGEPLGVKG
jgi:putative hydrolase of the HAD superfamily